MHKRNIEILFLSYMMRVDCKVHITKFKIITLLYPKKCENTLTTISSVS